MSREAVISALAALGCHALLLFGLQVQKDAVPLPPGDTAVEVSLVAAAPDAATPEPLAAETAPPPTPVPEPIPEPPLPEPMTVPTPEAKPKPRPPEALSRPVPRPTKPSAAPRAGVPSGAGAGVGDSKPRYRSNPRPEYPAEARRQQQQGRVILEVEVSAGGRASSVALKRSSGFPALDAAALAAVRRWTFEPARTAGVPVAARVEVPVQFDLAR